MVDICVLYCIQEKFEDTKEVIRGCESKNDNRMAKRKRMEETDNDLQNTMQKTND